VQSRIEQDIQSTLKNVWNAYNEEQNGQAPQEPTAEPQQEPIKEEPKAEPITEPQPEENTEQEPSEEPQAEPEPIKRKKRIRINDREEHTLKIILELEAQEPQREYLPADITAITKRSPITETKYLKMLWIQGKLNRELKNRKQYYSLATNSSRTVSHNPMTNPESLTE